MDWKREVMLAVGAKNLIKKTGPTIVQSSVSGYRLMFVQVRAGLVGDRLVVVILGRQQVRLGEKERFVVECGQKENVKDYVIAIREDLLEQSVNSSEDITQQDDVHGDTWGGGMLRLGRVDIYMALAMPALTLLMLTISKLLYR